MLNVPAGKEVMEKWGWRPDPDQEHITLPHEVTAHDTHVVLSSLEDLHLVCGAERVLLRMVLTLCLGIFSSFSCIMCRRVH